jgi:cold shock CspA family protein
MSKPRTAISGPRQTGTITEWKGSFGWIQPSKAVNHPAAAKRGGKIYLAVEDVVEELDGVGAAVNFTLYSDATGLGAADVKMAKGAAAAAPAATPAKAGKGKSSAVAQYRELSALSNKGASKGAKGSQAPAAKGRAAAQSFSEPPAKKGKSAGKKGPGKREMLHDEPLIGTIIQWKGKFGWITPNDTIDHPLASKNRGDLYVAQEDVEEEIEGEGAVVQFMLYGDDRGLGAANVKPAEQN